MKKNILIFFVEAQLRYLLTRSYDYLNTPKDAYIKIKDPRVHTKIKVPPKFKWLQGLLKIMIKIYTDGSCIGNPGKGGWAAIIIIDGEKKLLLVKR